MTYKEEKLTNKNQTKKVIIELAPLNKYIYHNQLLNCFSKSIFIQSNLNDRLFILCFTTLLYVLHNSKSCTYRINQKAVLTN